MKIVNCDCGESYWVNESGWPAMCRCGKKLEHRPLKEEQAHSSVSSSAGLSCCPNCGNEAKHYPESNTQANAIYCTKCPLGVEQSGMSDNVLKEVWENLPRAR